MNSQTVLLAGHHQLPNLDNVISEYAQMKTTHVSLLRPEEIWV